jgi:hypothetical protein
MGFVSIVVAGLLGVVTAGPSLADSVPDKATAKSKVPDAVFERDEPAMARMALTRTGAAWRIVFRAGGVPNGAATAADCELQAVGQQDADGVIAARLVPFEGELNVITAADIGAGSPVVQVRVGPEGAFVEDRGATARFCALGSDIDGFYRRMGEPD